MKVTTIKLSKEEILHCPRCGEVMIRDRMGFWRCPKCGGEFWDDESKLSTIRAIEAEKKAQEALNFQFRWGLGRGYTEVPPLIPIVDPNARGSRSSSKRKKPLPKPLMTERYRLN